MHIVNTKFHLDQFFADLSNAASASLLLDYDGTLAPFNPDPSHVTPYPGVVERLTAISRQTPTNLYLISGRDLDTLLHIVPNVGWHEIWGSHGGERLTLDQNYWRLPLTDEQKKGLEAAKAIAKDLPKACFCEQKPLSIAIHWRAIDDESMRSIVQQKIVQQWTPLIQNSGLALHLFNGGIEIRPKEMSKANVIKYLLSERAGHSSLMAYLGDDATDEEAFMALGEQGLKVLVRQDLPPSTHADVQIVPPNELLDFFDRWLQSMESKRS